MRGRKKTDGRRNRCSSSRRCKKVQRGTIIVSRAALPDPAAERHLIIKTYLFGELHEAHRIGPLPKILVAGRDLQHGLGCRHSALDVPGEKSKLQWLADMRVRLTSRIRRSVDHVDFLDRTCRQFFSLPRPLARFCQLETFSISASTACHTR